jgi:transcriptional regulator with PAS, ATPase and Fis domain
VDKVRLGKLATNDEQLLGELLPGTSQQMRKVRAQIAAFARNTSPTGALLLGPIGSGKSTVARTMALLRYLHFCTDGKREQIIRSLSFDAPFRIDKKSLNWFEELNLTGLVEQLAQSQLFGIRPRAATGVEGRPGIFEQAMTGHMEKGTDAARITGGIVLLDEIGDLPPNLQPLLLTVMTGTEVFRVGGEGDHDYGYAFSGSVIAATWKDPKEKLRPDLLSRLSQYVIRLPGLNERTDEMESITLAMQDDINRRHTAELERLSKEPAEDISRRKIADERERVFSLHASDVKLLHSQDWERLGDLRGLRQILDRSFYGQMTIAESIQEAFDLSAFATDRYGAIASMIVDELCAAPEFMNLPDELRRIEKKVREKFAGRIKTEPALLKKLAARAGVEEHLLKRQLTYLTRDRSGGRKS